MNLVLTRTETMPRYRFWQEIKQGRIVGFYLNSLKVALEQGVEPGWQYIVEREDDHVIISEGEVSA